jgi:hypothetical protein
MTYNFDPDKWYDIELGYLDARLRSGKMTKEEFNSAIEELDRQFEEICDRLDGTFQL